MGKIIKSELEALKEELDAQSPTGDEVVAAKTSTEAGRELTKKALLYCMVSDAIEKMTSENLTVTEQLQLTIGVTISQANDQSGAIVLDVKPDCCTNAGCWNDTISKLKD